MDFLYLGKWVAILILPPAGNFILLLAGWWMSMAGFRRLGRGLMWLSIASLLLLSLPLTRDALMLQIERYPALSAAAELDDRAGAIVVLGAGRYKDAPEYGADTVSRIGLERIRYGAVLHRRTGLPLLVSGGIVRDATTPEAELMRQVLEDEFQVPVRWLEEKSRNTQENADYSRELLEAAGIERVYLVTNAWHMPRAVEAFQRAGMQVVPAPMSFDGLRELKFSARRLVPSAHALYDSFVGLHELLGSVWYRIRYSTSNR